jgi:integrase
MAVAPYKLLARGKKGIYSVRFTAPDGQPVFRSSGTADRALASEWASKFHADLYRVARLGDKPRRRWSEAVPRWLDDHQHKRSLRKDIANLRWLDPWLRDKWLDEIDADLLADVATARKAEPRDKRRTTEGAAHTLTPTSQATVDRMLALVRSILRAAQGWGWLDKLPAVKLAPPANDDDYRWLTHAESDALHDALAEHLRPPFLFALATGWREQNVLRLEWTRVDLTRRVVWVTGRDTKGKRAIGAPLNRDAVAILQAQQGKHPRWVFPNEKGQPYVRANNHGFKAAQRRAGIAPLRWHDLRHTWASWHVMAGTSLRSLMELGGWRSYKSVLRYAHLSPEHLASDAARVEGLARKLHEHSTADPL